MTSVEEHQTTNSYTEFWQTKMKLLSEFTESCWLLLVKVLCVGGWAHQWNVEKICIIC